MATTLLLAIACLHISSVRSSKHASVGNLLLVYIMNLALQIAMLLLPRKMHKTFKDPRGTQETLLKDLMESNAKTVYGRKYKFQKIKQLDDLRNNHPLTDYSHYQSYVERMANGEENVLVSGPLERFGITSGTTGKGKLIPITQSRMSVTMSNHVTSMAVAGRKWGWPSPLQKVMMFYVNPRPTKTASGLEVAPMHYFPDNMKFASYTYTTPWEGFSITTDFEATYIVLLFGLKDSNVYYLLGIFSSTIHKSMVLLEKNWKRLVHDIETGTIDKDLQISADVREACEKVLLPDPERAEELRTEFEKGFDGIMRRVWPAMKFVFGIDTSNYTEKLEEGYARGT